MGMTGPLRRIYYVPEPIKVPDMDPPSAPEKVTTPERKRETVPA